MSVAIPTTPRKAFFATLFNDEYHGILTMDDHGAVWFRDDDTDELTLITPELYQFIGVGGEVGLANTQLLLDGDRVLRCSKTLVTA
jgi:hypothetical protein